MNIGILGSGQWAKALASLVAEAGNRPQIGYQGKSPGGFPGSPNLASVAKESDLLLIACPPRKVRETVKLAQPKPANHVLVAARGIEPQTGTWLSKVILEESAAVRVGALGGPTMAEEVMNRRPSAMVAASAFAEVRNRAITALHSSICRLYTSEDLHGVELASAMVDALSIALGLADALSQGVGVRGIIVTRGIAEASRLGERLGAKSSTFSGLAGVGDLVSCGSLKTHRGYAAGRELGVGRGISRSRLEELQALTRMAEKAGVELPLTEAVTAIALGKVRPRIAIDMLMRRKAIDEN